MAYPQKIHENDYSRNKALIAQAQKGDPAAMEKLIELNMGLIKSIVPRFLDRGIEYEDLMQIGAIGMIKAIRSFSEEYSTVFSTYAVPLIIGEIKRYLRDDGIIKVSRSIKRLSMHVGKTKERFMREHNREPLLSELSELCGASEEEIVMAMEASYPLHSLSETVGDDDSMTLEGTLPSDVSEIDNLCDRLALKEAIGKLAEGERKIIYYRYFKDFSQQQTAEVLGLSQVKISREEKKIFTKLRQQFLG